MITLLQVSFLPRDNGNAALQEEARKLGLEPRYIYRVTQVPVRFLILFYFANFLCYRFLALMRSRNQQEFLFWFLASLRWLTWAKAGR